MTIKLSSFENWWEGNEKEKSELEWHKWACAIGKMLDLERLKIAHASVFQVNNIGKAVKDQTDYIHLKNIGRYLF